jgi:hypothetical protein
MTSSPWGPTKAFDRRSQLLGQVFTAQASVAMTAAPIEEGLQTAMVGWRRRSAASGAVRATVPATSSTTLRPTFRSPTWVCCDRSGVGSPAGWTWSPSHLRHGSLAGRGLPRRTANASVMARWWSPCRSTRTSSSRTTRRLRTDGPSHLRAMRTASANLMSVSCPKTPKPRLGGRGSDHGHSVFYRVLYARSYQVREGGDSNPPASFSLASSNSTVQLKCRRSAATSW